MPEVRTTRRASGRACWGGLGVHNVADVVLAEGGRVVAVRVDLARGSRWASLRLSWQGPAESSRGCAARHAR